MKILLIGSGGREHALAWKMSQSKLCEKMYAAPGNPGIAEHAECVELDPMDADAVVAFAKENGVGLVVVGPEDPLANGLADAVRKAGILCFGPSAEGARIEADKAYAKNLMRAASVPTAEARVFTDLESAKAYVLSRENGVAVKASGLAKGKGVVVCPEPYQAVKPLEEMMGDRIFGDAGASVVIEEMLVGQEATVLAFCDGKNIYTCEPLQDHKPIGDGDTGPNTGGMGAYSPVPIIDGAMMSRIEREVLVPIVDAMRRDFGRYEGVLYAGPDVHARRAEGHRVQLPLRRPRVPAAHDAAQERPGRGDGRDGRAQARRGDARMGPATRGVRGDVQRRLPGRLHQGLRDHRHRRGRERPGRQGLPRGHGHEGRQARQLAAAGFWA